MHNSRRPTPSLLTEHTLWGSRDLVATATERLRALVPPEGYWLAFSGGKDSQVIYDLAIRAGVPFEAHYSLTTVDPPELVRFIREEYPEVAIDRPRKTMWQLIEEHGMPPTRTIRYCCEELKERGGEGRIVVTGVRRAESVRRRARQMVESCTTADKRYLHPILDWPDSAVWEYHRHIPRHCGLYDEGWTRIGCILCPMSRRVDRDIQRWPKIAGAYRRACQRAWQRRKDRGDTMQWTSGDDMFAWWIKRDIQHIDPSQQTLFPFE
jgi:phosphoadenosine phosphosulfate reductase